MSVVIINLEKDDKKIGQIAFPELTPELLRKLADAIERGETYFYGFGKWELTMFNNSGEEAVVSKN